MFNLPLSTKINTVVPKNTFDQYTNSDQKRAFTEKIQRIMLLNKLTEDSTNLTGKIINVIQLIEIELKANYKIDDLLTILDKIIPHHIIFVVRFKDQAYLSTSAKHRNSNDETKSVIDYTFQCDWFDSSQVNFSITLKNNFDWVYKNFCEQFNQSADESKNLAEFITTQKRIDSLTKEIERLNAEIKKAKQFNLKVELNLKLKEFEHELLRARSCTANR